MDSKAEVLRSQIFTLVGEYYQEAFRPQPFIPGKTPIPVSGRVFDACELQELVSAALDFWLTAGPFAAQFEGEFARFMGVNHSILVNSGSSANLLALSCLTSPALDDRRLRPGDEVITVACGFPTTVNPILQNQLIPVFVDVTLPTYNLDTTQLEAALSDRTKGIILAHTLGNPFDLDMVVQFARKNNLWLIEDCCDAVGATFQGRGVGTFGDLATASFYPAHHLTMGEGGCVLTNQRSLKKIAESFRDWGRDCWCEPGHDDTCGKRFDWQWVDLPDGYDHKYTYSHIGYNLKATDLQAAVGVAQLGKLPHFIETRHKNFDYLYRGMKALEEFFILPEPTPGSQPSWFGFALTVRPQLRFTRDDLVRHLNRLKIGTRFLFGGNLVRQPAYRASPYRVIGSLSNTDLVMTNTFWIGVYPGITFEMLDYVLDVMDHFCRG